MMLTPFGFVQTAPPVQTYTLDQQRALAASTLRKVRAFLLGAYRFEARYADYPNDRVSIKSGGVVLRPAQLEAGVRYNVFWDYQGESGSEIAWKFRGDSGLPSSVCTMEDSMADDPNVGMPGNLLQMAASTWAQTFYDMMVNYEIYGSVVKPEEPRPEHESDPDRQEQKTDGQPEKDHQPDEGQSDEEGEDYEDEEEDYVKPDYASMVATKWNAIFERVKTDEHDVECMFVHSRQGCIAPAGTCQFKHTPLADNPPSDGASRAMPAMDTFYYHPGMGWQFGSWD
ncbi:hypothetical protein B0H12DRAFT_1145799 [Mycena haematopus]|nr:hypothetical protein B0H12DRAFT_1145799 [Mycena haematopus]